MSTIFLATILAFGCFSIYLQEKRDIISPPVILCAVFFLSSIFLALNILNWNVNLHLTTILVILVNILCFVLSYWFAKNLKIKPPEKNIQLLKPSQYLEKNIFKINKYVMICIIAFSVMTCVMFYYERVRLASTLGISGSLNEIIYGARHAEYYTEESMSKGVQRFMLIDKCFAYVTAYVFINNIMISKKMKNNIIYIIPIILYCFLLFLSGGRMPFIHLFTFVAVLYGVLNYKILGVSEESRKNVVNIILKAFLGFMAIFVFMGFGANKFFNSVFDTISLYIASGINALDVFLHSDIPEEKYFGQETLIPIYSTLRSRGYNIPTSYLISAREFISMNGVQTNIYSAFRRYIRDYGYAGCTLIMSMMGFIYGKFYSYVLSEKAKGYMLILYAAMFFPIVEMPIEERFFLKLISMQNLYEIIGIYLFYRFMVKKDLSVEQNLNL